MSFSLTKPGCFQELPGYSQPLDAGPGTHDARRYLLLEQDLAEQFSWRLAHKAFHLHVQERSENLGVVQAGLFHEFMNGARFVRAKELVDRFLLRRGATSAQGSYAVPQRALPL